MTYWLCGSAGRVEETNFFDVQTLYMIYAYGYAISIKRRNDNIKVDIRETGFGRLDFLNDSCHVRTKCLNLLTVVLHLCVLLQNY